MRIASVVDPASSTTYRHCLYRPHAGRAGPARPARHAGAPRQTRTRAPGPGCRARLADQPVDPCTESPASPQPGCARSDRVIGKPHSGRSQPSDLKASGRTAFNVTPTLVGNGQCVNRRHKVIQTRFDERRPVAACVQANAVRRKPCSRARAGALVPLAGRPDRFAVRPCDRLLRPDCSTGGPADSPEDQVPDAVVGRGVQAGADNRTAASWRRDAVRALAFKLAAYDAGLNRAVPGGTGRSCRTPHRWPASM
jgi:hypothetical protein